MESGRTKSTSLNPADYQTPAGCHILAPYAENHLHSRGRLLEEPQSATRTCFQRDRDRVIHSDAFRRLKHKTQVFVHHEGDHYRTRLTHTIEVGQIARALARALRVDEDLAEALALVHDFGHTPFGHAGERALAAKMVSYGGFEHNAQSLRVVTVLEHRYAQFDGLNLTWEVLEGLVKHNGPLTDRDGDGLEGPVPRPVVDYNNGNDLWLWSWPSVEAQCAAIADDIAYDNHDLDDGLRAGLFDIGKLADVGLSARLLAQVDAAHPGLERKRVIHELVRRQITSMVEDVIVESSVRLSDVVLSCADDVRSLDYAVVTFSAEMEAEEKQLKAFLFENMYRHESVMAPVKKAQSVVADLFDRYFDDDYALQSESQWDIGSLTGNDRARKIADYIAGMTDRFAISEHRRLFDHTPELG